MGSATSIIKLPNPISFIEGEKKNEIGFGNLHFRVAEPHFLNF